MQKEISKTYDFKEVEDKQYQKWLDEGIFHADVHVSARPFSMVIPPPNITGVLHMGHALNNTLQDILARWNRMQGFNMLWVPGTDHAGIATQNIVEKQLDQEKKKKEDIGHEKFIQKVWEWKKNSGGTIIQQLKRLGCSCDWDRERFTMDEGFSKAVEEVFIRLFQEGLIYRSERLINWCTRCQTALSDIEVVYEESEGSLYFINYPFVDGQGALQVATTRPETLLGDTAVAVHPDDARYKSFVGKKVLLPLTTAQIPVISDSTVDREFGSGAVKVTPGHDFNDYEMGLRHRLPIENILMSDGKLVAGERTGEFAGMDIPLARKKILSKLKEKGYLVDTKKHLHTVGKCYRCRTIIEPYLSSQWFVRIGPLALPAIEAVRIRKIEFFPKGWENSYFSWMENIKDWCISRQLWWGHRIPAWYCLSCNPVLKNRPTPFLFKSLIPIVSSEKPKRCATCKGEEFIQDPDVLDTWFSSALWPFVTLGWPKKTEELKIFYPTSVLVTGFDILFFWVARMIMMGLKFMGDVPFRQVYIHALVRDAEGQKMSKSKGNVIDPIALMDQYGTDAFRYTLAVMAAPGRDILLDEDRFAGYRNFCNKVWNAARFILLNLKGENKAFHLRPASESLPDQWILFKLNESVFNVNKSLKLFRFDEAANALYHFIWHEYCDWYLELIKPILYEVEQADATHRTMAFTFEKILRLLHPFMPFITDALWPYFSHESASVLNFSYPQSDGLLNEEEKGIVQFMENLKEIIKGLRNIRGENNISPGRELKAFLITEEESASRLKVHSTYIKKLGKLSSLDIASSLLKPPYSATYVCDHIGTLYVDLAGVSDPKDEIKRLEKQIEKIKIDLALINRKFENPNFAKNAPEKFVKDETERKKLLEEKKIFLTDEISQLKSLTQQ